MSQCSMYSMSRDSTTVCHNSLQTGCYVRFTDERGIVTTILFKSVFDFLSMHFDLKTRIVRYVVYNTAFYVLTIDE